LVVLVFVMSLGTALAAQNPNPDITRRELQNFDNFLDTHPAVDKELTKNPRLIEDPSYIAAHPELKTFLADHPGVREEMKETPRFFMHREEQFDKSGRDITHREAASLDVFLDTHPGVERDLRKDPSLAKNPEFLQTSGVLGIWQASCSEGRSRGKSESLHETGSTVRKEREERSPGRDTGRTTRREARSRTDATPAGRCRDDSPQNRSLTLEGAVP
jgi:hypothetical protein